MKSITSTTRTTATSMVTSVALGLGALACSDPPPEPKPVVRPIKVLTIGGELAGTREYPGRIRAAQQADMAFEVEGRIIEFVYTEGTRVDAGEALARLDPRDYQNNLEQAAAVEKQARTYLARIEKAHRTNAVSDQDLNDAQAKVEVSEAETKIKRKALEDTILRAPFDGIMSRKLVQDFANVQAKEPVLVFEDDSLLEIKVSVPERDLAGRRPAQRTQAELNAKLQPKVMVTALPDTAFDARIKEIATTADPTTRTFEATFRFEPPEDVVVLPGMTAKVTLRMDGVAELTDVAIPAHAAQADEQGKASVWIFDPETNTVDRREVALGDLSGDDVVVTSGLRNGDQVAISGVSQLRSGMQVRRWKQ